MSLPNRFLQAESPRFADRLDVRSSRESVLCGSEVFGLSEWNDPISQEEGLGSGESAFSCSVSEMPVGRNPGKNQRENTRGTSGWRRTLKSHRPKAGISSQEAERLLGKSVDSREKG